MKTVVGCSVVGTVSGLKTENSSQRLPTHPEHPWADVLWSPGLIDPGPGELPSDLADHDGNWRCGRGVTVHHAGCQAAGKGRWEGDCSVGREDKVTAKPRS